MAIDPRKTYSVKYCPKNQVNQQADQQRRKSFLDSITKIGDLELLNDIGFGEVGEGLRALSAVSDSVRTNQSVVPGREGSDLINTAQGAIANIPAGDTASGAQAVLDTTGLGTAVQNVQTFNPDVANRAQGQAEAIFDKVKQGNFELSDIPEVFSDLQNLGTLADSIFTSSDTSKNERDFEMCEASPYARDLIAFAPKFNFMFVLDIKWAPAYEKWQKKATSTAFVVKTSSRPSVNFEYEDVNMYNFWTKVPKKVTYPDMTMNFYDDNKNSAHAVYTAYMRAMSPISNVHNGFSQQDLYEQISMDFNRPADGATFATGDPTLNGYASSLGPLNDNTKSLFSTIRLFHIFDYGRQVNVYNFYNPRILQMVPTELNMAESGEGAGFEFQFAYDGLFVESAYDLQVKGPSVTGSAIDLKTLTGDSIGATYPINPRFESDVKPNSSQSNMPSAQEQAEAAPTAAEQLARSTNLNRVGEALAGVGDGIANFASGVTGAINNGIASLTSSVSNAFKTPGSFNGSSWRGNNGRGAG